MDRELTLSMFYDLPQTIIDISKEKGLFEREMSNSDLKKYDTNEIKDKLSSMFSKFDSIKFYCNVKSEELIKITSSYGLKDWSSTRSNDSNQDVVITKRIDNTIWASQFYDSIINLSKSLTEREAIILSYGLIGNKTNEYIAEILNICERSVQPIKKSCIVKTWKALEALYEED